jgi:hypothetical protein
MAHNTYVKGTIASWATGTTVSQVEFAKFDANQYKSVNGDDGGTWAPSAAIVIGGAGLTVSGAFLATSTGIFTGGFAANSNASFGTTSSTYLYVYSSSTFFGPATISSGTSLTTAGELIATGSATFSGAFTISNDATVGSDSVDALTINATTSFESPVTTNDLLTCSAGLGANAISCSGTISALGGITCGGDLTSHGNTLLGDGASVSDLIVNATQDYTGPETHNGVSSFVGAAYFDAVSIAGNTGIGASSTNTLTVRSTTQFENNVTVGTDAADAFSVNSNANFLNNVTVGSDAADTFTSNAAAYFGSVRLGASGGDTVYVPGSTEFVNNLKYTTRTIIDNYEKINLSGSATRYEYHANNLIVTNMNGSDRILTIDTIGAAAFDGIVKHISHCDETSPGNTLTVLCGHSSRVLGVLTSGQGVRVICDGTQWYTTG